MKNQTAVTMTATNGGPRRSLAGLDLSAAGVAQLLGVSRTQVYTLRGQGLPTSGRGRYPALDCVRWFIERMQRRQLADRRRVVEQQTRARRPEAAEVRGSLVPATEVQQVVRLLSSLLVETLDAVEDWADDPVVRDELRTRVRDHRQRLERRIRAMEDGGDPGSESAAADDGS